MGVNKIKLAGYVFEERALNTYSTNLQEKTLGFTGMLVISSFITIFGWGCLENYGRLKRSHDVKTSFETGQLPSDYHYHFYGNRNHRGIRCSPRRSF